MHEDAGGAGDGLVQGVQKRAHGRVGHQGESQKQQVDPVRGDEAELAHRWSLLGPPDGPSEAQCARQQRKPAALVQLVRGGCRCRLWSSLCGFSASCVVGCRLNGATQPGKYCNGGQGNGCGQREAPTAEDGFPQSNGLGQGGGPIGSTHQFLEVACLGHFEWRRTAESAVPDEHGGVTGGADDAEVHFTLPPLLAHHVHNAAHEDGTAYESETPV